MTHPADARRRPTVAVVDDDKDIRAFVDLALGHACAVDGYPGGAEALAGFAAAPPDLALLDLDMPGMDGWEVMRHLRAHPRLRHVPVLAFTATSLYSSALAAAGFAGVVQKPVADIRTFVDTVTAWTAGRGGTAAPGR